MIKFSISKPIDFKPSFRFSEAPLNSDVRSFQEAYRGKQVDSLGANVPFNLTHGNQSNVLNRKMNKTAKKAEQALTNAAKEEILQRVEDQKNAMRYKSNASAVKKATEIINEIKF